MATTATLKRQLSLSDAVFIGLGSMIGAGVFVAFGPAAKAAGNGMLIGLVIAAVIAYCNAVASAQLAAQYPASGGTYVYGREQLNDWAGFLAGWGFVIGKTASCTAMALTLAMYVAPDWQAGQKWIAIGTVVAMAILNCFGVAKTVTLTRVLVTISLITLVVMIVGILTSGETNRQFITSSSMWQDISVRDALQSAGFLFFAFAGYARIATMGEEVKEPRVTIPIAIPRALGITAVVYAVVGVTLLLAIGATAIGTSSAPLVTALEAVNRESLVPLMQVGAAVASLGALLGLMAGIGRTSLAMARNGDLPRQLAQIHPRYQVPHIAEISLASVVVVLLLFTDIRGAIGFSSFGVLCYYAIANLSAWTQSSDHRRWPRWWFVLGFVGCVTLVTVLPLQSVLTGLAVYAIGIGYRLIAQRVSPATA